MKTVLVLTLLAMTIACCYARPAKYANEPSWASWQSSHSETAEHFKHPEHLGKWLAHTIVMHNELVFYILGTKQSELEVDCFNLPGCFGPGKFVSTFDCCVTLWAITYRIINTMMCFECSQYHPWGKLQYTCSWCNLFEIKNTIHLVKQKHSHACKQLLYCICIKPNKVLIDALKIIGKHII